MVGIGVLLRFRIVIIVLFQDSWNHVSSQTLSDEPKHDGEGGRAGGGGGGAEGRVERGASVTISSFPLSKIAANLKVF